HRERDLESRNDAGKSKLTPVELLLQRRGDQPEHLPVEVVHQVDEQQQGEDPPPQVPDSLHVCLQHRCFVVYAITINRYYIYLLALHAHRMPKTRSTSSRVGRVGAARALTPVMRRYARYRND